MDDMWDEPGDLAWLDQKDDVPDEGLEHDDFYEPHPGEEEL